MPPHPQFDVLTHWSFRRATALGLSTSLDLFSTPKIFREVVSVLRTIERRFYVDSFASYVAWRGSVSLPSPDPVPHPSALAVHGQLPVLHQLAEVVLQSVAAGLGQDDHVLDRDPAVFPSVFQDP